MKPKLYYKGATLGETDYSEMSETFKIPYDTVCEVISQIENNGEPVWASYTGAMRANVENLFDAVSTTLDPVDPTPLSPKEEIVDDAAISLIRAISHSDENSFFVNEQGVCEINTSNPPSLVKSYELVHQVLKVKELGPAIDDKTSWMLGSIVYGLEELHGEDFEVGQVVEATDKAYNTIYTAVKVYKAFKDKRYNLSYSHHKEAFFKKIPMESKRVVLKKAELYGLRTADVRDLCSIIKRMDDDQVVRNIRSKDGALALIDAYKEAKSTYYVFNDDGTWIKIKSLSEDPPAGRIVINTSSETVTIEGGEPIEILECKKNTKPS